MSGDAYNGGNPGWSGSLYTGIPASGYRTNIGLAPTIGPNGDAGGLEELPSANSFVFGADYFLSRGQPTSIATDYLRNPWSALPPGCLRKGCFDPPGQFCRNLECGRLSYPMTGDICLSAEKLLSDMTPGEGPLYTSGGGTKTSRLS
jgi:hypothetical protein